jgi:hypothetical protein
LNVKGSFDAPSISRLRTPIEIISLVVVPSRDA